METLAHYLIGAGPLVTLCFSRAVTEPVVR